MEHLDARAVRERLNTIALALTTLDENPHHAGHVEIATRARAALQEISVLITDDELEEHGVEPVPTMQEKRMHIRAATARRDGQGR